MQRFGALVLAFFLCTGVSTVPAWIGTIAIATAEVVDPHQQELASTARMIASLDATVKHYLIKGELEKAAKVALSLLMTAKVESQKFGNFAVRALERGDKEGARNYLKKAYDYGSYGQILEAEIGERGLIHAKVTDDRTGQVADLGKFDTPQVIKFTLSLANGETYFHYLIQVASAQRCPVSLAIDAWRSCIKREFGALLPSPARMQLPPWLGERPAMPAHYGTKELAAVELFHEIAPSVYLVVAGQSAGLAETRNRKVGSAVAVSKSTVLTNCHVVVNEPDHVPPHPLAPAQQSSDTSDPSILIYETNSSKPLKANIIHADQRTDRCILKVGGELKPISAVRRLDHLSVGARVYTIGNPAGLSRTLGEGLISGLRQRDGIHMVQTTAQISKGSSGGALIDSTGALVGITSS